MSLQHTPDGKTSKKVLRAVAKAILALEQVTGSFQEHQITKDDDVALCSSVRSLWSILEGNGMTLDLDTNRLTRLE